MQQCSYRNLLSLLELAYFNFIVSAFKRQYFGPVYNQIDHIYRGFDNLLSNLEINIEIDDFFLIQKFIDFAEFIVFAQDQIHDFFLAGSL